MDLASLLLVGAIALSAVFVALVLWSSVRGRAEGRRPAVTRPQDVTKPAPPAPGPGVATAMPAKIPAAAEDVPVDWLLPEGHAEKASELERAVAASFAEPDRAAALDALREYRFDTSLRVPAAILVLAWGEIEELRSLVRDANGDFRDVLLWVEYTKDPAKRREYAARYRRLGLLVPEGLASAADSRGGP